MKPDKQLAEIMGEFYGDPLGYVMFNFPWDQESANIQSVPLVEPWKSKYGCEYGPDKWACEFLDQLGEEVKKRKFNGKDAVRPIRFSTSSGHGIGKSTLVAWLVMWLMDCRPFCRGTVTANTAEQLKTKTWAEVGKWHSLALTRDWYTYSNTRGAMGIRRNGYETQWFCTAQTCKEENSESFAGQHAANSTSFYIFDEASGIPSSIYQVREGGLTDGHPMIFDFGNPTQNSGNFYENTVGKFKEGYITRCIDSRNVYITNKQAIEDWKNTWGEESDFFKIRVRGVFPNSSNMQFIGQDVVEAAQTRPLPINKYSPLIIGVDVSRFGEDESIIYPRLGDDARSFPFKRYIKLDAAELTDKIIQEIQYFRSLGKECQALFVDSTGIGGPVTDFLFKYGYNPIRVNFGNSAINKNLYRYVSDEIWGNTREALRTTLCIPSTMSKDGRDLATQLTQREYGYTTSNRIHLEPKDEMKARGIDSPDIADALAVTFAHPINIVHELPNYINTTRVVHEYDPFDTKDI